MNHCIYQCPTYDIHVFTHMHAQCMQPRSAMEFAKVKVTYSEGMGVALASSNDHDR